MRSFRPTSPSSRTKTVTSFTDLERSSSEAPRALVVGKNKRGGRNNNGRITTRHKGGGHKRRYRLVDFRRKHEGVNAKVLSFHYDPNRSARLALLGYANGDKGFIIAPVGLKRDAVVETGPNSDIKPGNALPLANIPVGSTVHCIELKPGAGAQLVRSAGMSAQLLGKEGKDAQIRLPSGEVRKIDQRCYATLGQVGNIEHEGRVLGKAGRKRWLGVRPTNRGTTMNPVDHPHGGGEGRTAGGRHPVSPWGQPTKGYKTRTNKRTQGRIIRGRPRGKMTKGK